MILVENLVVRAGAFRVEVDRFEVEKGEYMVLMGPSGAGKTVLLEAMVGVRPIEKGRVIVDGRDVSRDPPEKRGFSYVPQSYALWPHMTVFENIAYGLKLRKLDRLEVRRKVEEIAAELGIADLLHRRPYTLSGGEMQRVALARALVVEPRAVLLDEPLSSLDQATREEVKKLLKELHERLGFTAIHVTHDPLEAAELGDRVAVMYRGKLLQVGDPIEVMRNPSYLEAAGLYGPAVFLEGRIKGVEEGLAVVETPCCTVYASLRGRSCRTGDRAIIVLRPEDVVVYDTPPKGSSLRNILECRVEGVRDKGPLLVLDLVCGELRLRSTVTRGSYEHLGLGEGSRIWAGFKASAASIVRC